MLIHYNGAELEYANSWASPRRLFSYPFLSTFLTQEKEGEVICQVPRQWHDLLIFMSGVFVVGLVKDNYDFRLQEQSRHLSNAAIIQCYLDRIQKTMCEGISE